MSLGVRRATALFLLAGCGLPVAVAGIYAPRVEAGWEVVFIVCVAAAWGVAALFGGLAYHALLARRARRLGSGPGRLIPFLLGLAFAPLPAGLVLLAERREAPLFPEGLIMLAVASAGVAAACAGLTPLRP